MSMVALAGCTTQGGPTALPKDAYAAMWSTRSVNQVADCIVQRTGMQPNAGYRVEPTRKNPTYTTQVFLIERDIPADKEKEMALCLIGNS